MEELGSGFYLAMHDLEIRGAGEVLGESQSGEMQEIGFQLYSDMLNEAVRALKRVASRTWRSRWRHHGNQSARAGAAAGDYCGDVHERLSIYKRLANCATLDELTRCRKS